MTNHKERSPTRAGAEGKTGVPGLHQGAPKTLELREKHRAGGQGALTAAESKDLLQGGNTSHQAEVSAAGVSPRERHNRILSRQADYLVIACSDARNPTFDKVSDGIRLVGIQIRVAGNVIPAGGPSYDEIREAVRRLKTGGLVLMVGHVSCGAVGEYVKWDNGGRPDTGSVELDDLLHQVKGRTPELNALGQLHELEKLLGADKQAIALIYDWNTGKAEVLGQDEVPDLVQMFTSRLESFHNKADTDGNLGQYLSATQKPHAIVVASNDMPYGVDTVFDARQSELFATTGSPGGLDHCDAASVLYAVEHLGVKHIAFVAPDADPAVVSSMYDKWEANLRAMGSVAEKLDSGALVITRYAYDLSNGACMDMAA